MREARSLPAPALLGPLLDGARVRPYDAYLAETLGSRGGESDARVLACVALASHALSQGNVCYDLGAIAGEIIIGDVDPVESTSDDDGATRFGRREDIGDDIGYGGPEPERADGSGVGANSARVVRATTDGVTLPSYQAAGVSRRAADGASESALALAAGARELASIRFPDLDALRELLLASPLVSADGHTPCVLDDDARLYVQRYWRYEQLVAAALRARAEAPAAPVDGARLGRVLERWFPPDPATGAGPDAQAMAAALACVRPLLVVTGGPGTGKTTTLARIVGVLAELHAGEPLRMALVAPTGKGANRARAALAEVLMSGRLRPDARALVPRTCSTIHRLIGARRGEQAARYHAGRELPLDVLLVDEASMVDLRLMHLLLAALPSTARLILLGDADQLASVEPGTVLADLDRTTMEPVGVGADATVKTLAESVSGPPPAPGLARTKYLADTRVRLSRAYRFGAGGAIGALADAIKAGRSDEVIRLLETSGELDLRSMGPSDGECVASVAATRYRELWLSPSEDDSSQLDSAHGHSPAERPHAGDPEASDTEYPDAERSRAALARRALRVFGRLQLLSPYRAGPLGTGELNALVSTALTGPPATATWSNALGKAVGQGAIPRPILVTRNDYRARLFNGDIGVLLEHQGGARAYFPEEGELEPFPALPPSAIDHIGPGIRTLSIARLPAWELAFATTVHKAQGSEFDRVMLALPERRGRSDEPLVTRELLYTAVTRARASVEIWSEPEVLARAVHASAARRSGLGKALLRSLGDGTRAPDPTSP